MLQRSQDCRDILNAVPKRNPMIVPTVPVRKITSAWDIWTDQTRNRTSTTVEFCIAKMIPNRSRIPPRISLNLVVMVSWFSLSSYAPHTERLRLFKHTVCGSSNQGLDHIQRACLPQDVVPARHSESNWLMILIIVVPFATRCDRCACGCELDARICAISPRRNPGFGFRILAASNAKPPLRAPRKTGVEEAQRQVISVRGDLDLASSVNEKHMMEGIKFKHLRITRLPGGFSFVWEDSGVAETLTTGIPDLKRASSYR